MQIKPNLYNSRPPVMTHSARDSAKVRPNAHFPRSAAPVRQDLYRSARHPALANFPSTMLKTGIYRLRSGRSSPATALAAQRHVDTALIAQRISTGHGVPEQSSFAALRRAARYPSVPPICAPYDQTIRRGFTTTHDQSPPRSQPVSNRVSTFLDTLQRQAAETPPASV